MIPLPLMNLKVVALGALVVGAFFTGWTVNGWRHDAAVKKALQETIDLQHSYATFARKVTIEFQDQQAKQVIVYRDLKGKVKDVTDDRICFADSNALSVWNSALTGTVSTTATRAVEETSTTDTTTDSEVLSNAIENFEQSKQVRDQLNALIDWYEDSADIK